ncbi:ZBED4 protein, partial [Amia calva]|nr:ZBED4 protein [Amia calva]
ITDVITFFIPKDICPVSTVGNQGFKKLVNTLDKCYAMPSRHHFTRVALPTLHNKCCKEVANDASTAEYFATTMDIWSSRTMEPYISLTINYIDFDFNLKTKCLQTAFSPEDHMGQNIAPGLREVLAAFGLKEDKLICITTDNASNIKLAADVNGWMRLQCFGHRLHSAIGEWAGLSISQSAQLLGFSRTTISRVYKEWCEKGKTSSMNVNNHNHLVGLNVIHIFFIIYVHSKEKAPLETAVMPADDMEDAAGPKKKKKGLGSFFKVIVGKAAGPALKVPMSTVASIIRKWKKFGTTRTVPRAGRPTKLSDQGRRALFREVTKNPMVTLTEL